MGNLNNSGGNIMEKEKIVIISLFAITGMLFLLQPVVASTVVPGLFNKTYTFDLTQISGIKSCKVQANYESGVCQYLYACYVVLPQGSTDLYQVYQKECVEVTGQTSAQVNVSIMPPIGKIYAISPFVAVVNYTYDNVNYKWKDPVTEIPLNMRQAEDIVTLCPKGQMLRGNLCYDSVGICANTLSSNMCTNNMFDAFCLDIPNATFATFCDNGDHNLTTSETTCMLTRCNGNVYNLCTDRNKDRVCDSVISLTCTDATSCKAGDTPGHLTGPYNNICDDSDQIYCGTQCTDANLNGVCDSVETSGCFCQLTYSPVCWMLNTSTQCLASSECLLGQLCYGSNVTSGAKGLCANATTYPNQCFATCAGKSGFTSGACIPKVEQIQCMVNTDCLRPVGCPTTTMTIACINYMCSYTGICQQQCASDTDCSGLSSFCVGVTSSCDTVNHYCKINGKCITQPTAPPSIWSLIISIWNSFVAWLKGVLGWTA